MTHATSKNTRPLGEKKSLSYDQSRVPASELIAEQPHRMAQDVAGVGTGHFLVRTLVLVLQPLRVKIKDEKRLLSSGVSGLTRWVPGVNARSLRLGAKTLNRMFAAQLVF